MSAHSTREALPHFYKAQEVDPNFVVSLFFAALCEGNLGTTVNRDSLYELVLAQRHKLSPYYVHRAESQLAPSGGSRIGLSSTPRRQPNWGRVQRPGTTWPTAHSNQNRPKAAREALLQLDPDKEPMKGWYSYHGMLARVHHELGDYDAEMAVFRDAVKRYPNSRSPMLVEVQEPGGYGPDGGAGGGIPKGGGDVGCGGRDHHRGHHDHGRRRVDGPRES